tara:strand:- start:172 stop:1101 length:930 start_codon:yes stop_codon:yes gene_type:complete
MSKEVKTFIASICLLINFQIANSEVFIKGKINNQIITNIDVKNEKNYLLALNPNLRNLSEENINQYAIDSLVNEKVKKIEIEKKFEIIENNVMIDKILSDLYSGLGISSKDEFEQHLKSFDIDLGIVKNKISIEIAWNDYIFKKFNNSVLIDEDKIKKKIIKLSENNFVDSFLLSEIIFTVNENENLDEKLKKIRESISQIGFSETAKIYSVSESGKNGGKIGWVYKSQLSNKISEKVENIDIDEVSEPITTPGGFILLQLNEKKNQLIEIDEEEQFKRAIKFEENRQLKMYSTLHYKRVYNGTKINVF